MARPTTLTPEVAAAVCEAVAAGCPRDHAAKYAGITPGCLKNWITKGRRGEAPYADFVEALSKAGAVPVVRNVAIIQAAAKSSWQAAAWWLERVHWQDFARDAAVIKRLEQQVAALERTLKEKEGAAY